MNKFIPKTWANSVVWGGSQKHGKRNKRVRYWDYMVSACTTSSCDECDNNPPTKIIIIGVRIYSVCAGCYDVVLNRPRSFNRAGRRDFVKNYKKYTRQVFTKKPNARSSQSIANSIVPTQEEIENVL